MVKITGIISMLLFNCLGVYAQYFYKDIISVSQANQDMANYKSEKVKSFKIKSFEDDGRPSEGFAGERKFSRDFKTSELFTKTDFSGVSLVTSTFNESGKLVQSIDSSEISTSRSRYIYDDDGRLKSIISTIRSSDDDFVNEITEEHLYVYTEDFFPDKMLRIKNRVDTTLILFSKDENNNISIEKDMKSGNKYFYYYDGKSRLTDVVNSSEYKERLIAEYMFEYNEGGQLNQMITTEEGGSNYFIWKYSYSGPLRISEKCYSKKRQLLGSIEYEYKK